MSVETKHNRKKLLIMFLILLSSILVVSGVTISLYIRKYIRDGERFMQSGRYERAAYSFKKMIGLTDAHLYPSIYLNLGIAYAKLKKIS